MFKPGDFHKSFPTLTTLIILMSSVCFRTSLSVVLLWMKELFFFFSPATGSQKKWKILLLLCLDLLLLFWFGLVDCFFCFVVGFFWLVWFLVFVVCWVFLFGWLVFIVGVWFFFFCLVWFCFAIFLLGFVGSQSLLCSGFYLPGPRACPEPLCNREWMAGRGCMPNHTLQWACIL